ncbi:MAG: BamA/TamA family outer membrane protein [Chlorobi bacterium]|nr:BamA/TamA family outer membrane protein [Chlorobiota bacterium]
MLTNSIHVQQSWLAVIQQAFLSLAQSLHGESLHGAALVCTLLLLLPAIAIAQTDEALPALPTADTLRPFILRDVVIDRRNVFDTSGRDLPLVAGLLNSLHAVTKEQVILHEVYLRPGDTVTQKKVDEIERNLRAIGIFQNVTLQAVLADSTARSAAKIPHGNLSITTRDGWSTQIGFGANTGGNAQQYSLSLREVNVAGLSYQASVGGDYSSVNERGWGINGTLGDPNIFGSHIQASGKFSLSKLDNVGVLSVGRPYFSDYSQWGFGTTLSYLDGIDYLYTHTQPVRAIGVPLRTMDAGGWYGGSRGGDRDLFRWAVSLAYDRTVRDSLQQLRPAFENSVRAFAGIASLRRQFVRMNDVQYHGQVLAPVGAMGGAYIGKISPHNGGLDNVLYVGGEVRQAGGNKHLYGFAALQAGTGFVQKETRFTLQRAVASGVWCVGPGAFTGRFEQSTVWRWPRYIATTLDNLSGLRGYQVNGLVGDNRLLFNLEYSALPDWQLLFFKFGAAAFFDVGGIWNQSEKLSSTRFHSSAGLGVRITNLRVALGRGVLRIDFPYNFDQKKFTQVVFSTETPFDAFGALDTPAPGAFLP